MRCQIRKQLRESLFYAAFWVLFNVDGTAYAFGLYSPLVEEGEMGVETRYANVVAGEVGEKGSQVLAAALEWSFSDAWRTEFSAEYFKAKGMSSELDSYEIEFVRALSVQGGNHSVSTALVFGGAFPQDDMLANSAEIGLYLEKGFGAQPSNGDEEGAQYASALLLNLYLSHQYGNNAESGLEFEYAAQYKWKFSGVAFGLEMYGETGKVSDMPAFNKQEHYVGPVLFGDSKLGKDMGLAYEVGYLLGVTDMAADGIVKVNVGLEF